MSSAVWSVAAAAGFVAHSPWLALWEKDPRDAVCRRTSISLLVWNPQALLEAAFAFSLEDSILFWSPNSLQREEITTDKTESVLWC